MDLINEEVKEENCTLLQRACYHAGKARMYQTY
jgi:hypothetical protein